MRQLLTIFLLLSAAAHAQVVGQNKDSDHAGAYTLTVKSQLVIETVVVKDKKGDLVGGLTAKDFTLTEDGIPQAIRFCEHQELPATPTVIPVTPADSEDVKIYKRLSNAQIAPEPAGTAKYKDSRLLALY